MDKRVKLMFKNMIFLYIRMFVIMCINLLAVRIVASSIGGDGLWYFQCSRWYSYNAFVSFFFDVFCNNAVFLI